MLIKEKLKIKMNVVKQNKLKVKMAKIAFNNVSLS